MSTYLRGLVDRLAALPADTDSRDWPEASEFLYKRNEPLLWAQICSFAFAKAQDSVVQIWLLIEYINGWRRQVGKWDMEIALEILDVIHRRISYLPDTHPRRDRLKKMWLYHSGIIHHLNGDFSDAAACHEISALRAEGDKRQVYLGLYFQACESLEAALKEGRNISITIKAIYADFKRAAGNLLADLSESENDFRWRNNILYHQILYAWLAEEKYPSRREVAFLDELPDKLQPAFADGAVVLRSLAVFRDDPAKAEEIARCSGPVAETDDYGFAQLIRKRAFLKLGKPTDALLVLNEYKNFLKDHHGGHLALSLME